MQIIHALHATATRLREDAKPYAREGMTATQARKYPASRTWCIDTPLGRLGVHETLGRYDGPTLVVVGGHHGDEQSSTVGSLR